jgi:cyanophycinase
MGSPGPLVLVGGDEFNEGNEPHDELLVRSACARQGEAFVLVTAAARQGPDAAVANARRWFSALGLDVDELPARGRRDANSEEVAARATNGSFFYLVGGDPGLVVKVLGGSRVWAAIQNAWQRGAALAGSSAGAMALCEWTLVRDAWPGHERRRYLNALGLVPGVAVLPHYGSFGRGWVHSALESAPRQDVVLLGLDERTAASWSESVWRASGPGRVRLIRPGGVEEFGPGDRIDGLPQPR